MVKDEQDMQQASPFCYLADDIILDEIFAFVGVGHYRYIAGTNRLFRRLYMQCYLPQQQQHHQYLVEDRKGGEEESFATSKSSIVESISRVQLFLNETRLKEETLVDDEDYLRGGLMKTRWWTVIRINIMAMLASFLRFLWRSNCCADTNTDSSTSANAFKNKNNTANTSNNDYSSAKVISKAAGGSGNLELIQWLHKNAPGFWKCEVAEIVTANGDLEMLKWVAWEGYDWCFTTCVNIAAQYGHLHVLKWVNKCCWKNHNTRLIFRYIMPKESPPTASRIHFRIWFCHTANTHSMDWKTCEAAATSGHLEVLKWIRQNRCTWDYSTCAGAASNGHLEVLKWARRNGCDWNSFTCSSAASGGHLEVLQWARQNGCEWNQDMCCSAAERNGHLEVVQWIRDNGRD